MVHLERPTSGSTSSRRNALLLSCGIVSSLLWPVSSEVLAALLYPAYNPLSQAVSELTSIGAPTRPLMLVEGFIYSALLVAFGIGVLRSARGNRALRATGVLLVVYGAVGPLWYPFPMTARDKIGTTSAATDVMHVVLGVVDSLLFLSILAVGAAALGRRFRIYSIVTLATVAVFGVLTFSTVPRIAAAQPTPWLGVVERIELGAFLLWVAVLAVVLLRATRPTAR